MTTNRDVRAAIMMAAAMVLAVLITDSIIVRMTLALPLLFFVTGHLGLRMIGTRFTPVEHALAAVGLSLAFAVAGCFALYGVSKLLSRSALTPIGWSLWVLAVVGVLSIGIVVFNRPGGLVIVRPLLGRGPAAIIAIAVAIVCGGYLLAIHDEASYREFAYTEFWLVPTTPGKFTLGIKNLELHPETYGIRVTGKDGVTLAELRSIQLNPDQVWTRTIDSRYKTDALLYRGDHEPVLYRRVSALPNIKDEE